MILAILQARLSSKRLPGKVLLPILEKPMLLHQINRIKSSTLIDHLVVATSTQPEDKKIAELCRSQNIDVFQGSLDDVLDRFYQVSNHYQDVQHVVRVTGDCPLIDPEIVDNVIQKHVDEKNDYSSNCLNPTFPDGLDVEIFTYKTLQIAWQNATLSLDREHVTSYISSKPSHFKLGEYRNSVDLSFLRWTVDEKEDFELITQIYQNLYRQNPHFGMHDVLELLKKYPELEKINTQYKRNENFIKKLTETINPILENKNERPL